MPKQQKNLDLGRLIQEGGQLFIENIGSWLLLGVVIFFGSLFTLKILAGPLICISYMILLRYMDEKITDWQLFNQLGKKFLPAFLAALILGAVSIVATIFFIIPLFLVAPFFLLVFPLLAEKELDAFRALLVGFQVVKDNYLNCLLLSFFLIFLILLGYLFLFIGIIVTLPLVMCIVAVTYRELSGEVEKALSEGTIYTPHN